MAYKRQTYKKPIFKELENEADYYKMSQPERDQYDYELMNNLIYESTIDYAERRGIAKAEAKAYQEKLESARRFMQMGLTAEQISLGTGLPIEEINKL